MALIRIEDSVRNNLVTWAAIAQEEALIEGVVLSPFSSPVTATPSGYKQGVQQTVERLQAAGCSIWLDPTTHALQMPGVGDFRYYDQWQLWPGPRGELTTLDDKREHVRRVFLAQDRLGVPRMAPTILLHSPQSQTSLAALELAQVAADLDSRAIQSISGDSQFWSGGDDLDAHIGALAQIDVPTWCLSVARVTSALPVIASQAEISGLCRTSRSLREAADVHISHGDLAALPAVAAGANSIGTGWDVRQRVLAYPDYAERDDTVAGGQWYMRPTLEGLVGSLRPSEFAVLDSQRPRLASRLLAGTLAPGAQDRFLHHLRILSNLVTEMESREFRERFEYLQEVYETAAEEWETVVTVTGSALGFDDWIKPFLAGLCDYGSIEGW